MPRPLHCTHGGTQQDERMVIDPLSGDEDVGAGRRGKLIEGEVEAFLSGFLPLAYWSSFVGDDWLRVGHGERIYTRSTARSQRDEPRRK